MESVPTSGSVHTRCLHWKIGILHATEKQKLGWTDLNSVWLSYYAIVTTKQELYVQTHQFNAGYVLEIELETGLCAKGATEIPEYKQVVRESLEIHCSVNHQHHKHTKEGSQ